MEKLKYFFPTLNSLQLKLKIQTPVSDREGNIMIQSLVLCNLRDNAISHWAHQKPGNWLFVCLLLPSLPVAFM